MNKNEKCRLSYDLNHFTRNLLKIMRVLIILLGIGLGSSYANSSYSQTKIDIAIKDASLIEFFEVIQSNTEFVFFYKDDVLNDNLRISVNLKKVSLEKILESAFLNTSLSYKISDKQVIIKKLVEKSNKLTSKNLADLQETITVTGSITEAESGMPLPAANILEVGTSNGVMTDFDGNYSIEVSEDAILTVSYIGYTTKEIQVNGQSEIDVVLETDAAALDDVVVVGYGTQQKYSVISSVSTIEPEELQNSSSRSISSNLAGRLPGVIAVQRSGEMGFDNAQFWIRGISSFAGNSDPLVLVDGVERSLNNIDPAEIENFSILKDAAASAVYGVRGANGVILITTKRGKIGKPQMNVRYEHSLTQPIHLPEFIGAADYLEVMNSIAEENDRTLPFSQERIDNIRSETDPDLYPNVNWLDEITKEYASNDRLNLTVSGGTELLRYAFVASYYGESGIIERDSRQEWDSSPNLDRYNLRSNVDLNITPSTLFRVSIGGYLQDMRRAPQSVDNLFNMAFETPPYQHPRQYSSGEIPVQPERANPWALATQSGYERQTSSKLESLFSIEQNLDFLVEGLKTTFKFSFDRYNANGVIRSKEPDYYNPATGRLDDGSLDLTIYRYGQDFLGYETNSEWGDKAVYLEGRVEYSRNFKNHQIDGLLLYNQRNYDNGDRLPYRNQGFSGRLSYSFKRKYIAEFNFGYNGSENFAKGQRYGFFPSVAAGWLISEEPFLKEGQSTISNLKIRASYGLVGNDQLGGRRFPYITTIGNTDGYTWGVNNDYSRAGRWEGDYGVPNLTWETVAKTNFGIELGLWNNINLTADIFKEQRRDIFMQRRTVPGSSGFVNNPWANYGKVNNQGFEFSLNINKQLSKDFSLKAWGNFSYARNEIIEQDEPLAVIGTNRSSTGKPVGQIFGLVADGLFTEEDFSDINNGELIEEIPNHTFGPVRPGDIKYKDINGDGTINALDNTAIGGTYNPEIVYGYGFNMQYKNFDLGLFFQGNTKTDRIIGGQYFIPGTGAGALGNIYSNVDDRWTVENPKQNVFWPRLSNQTHANNSMASTWWLRDMSMLRLKNAEIGYIIPRNLTKKLSIKTTRFYIRGNNLLTFSSFDLWDPEIDTTTGFRYPPMQSFTLGLDVNF